MEDEFQVYYKEYHNYLCQLAFRIVREKVTAREIVQDAFVELWQKGNWRELNSVKAFLSVVVYNRSITVFHNQQRFFSVESMPHQILDKNSSIEAEELEAHLLKGIESLPDQCRTIFLLSREAEMTYAQIAESLGLSVKTVERQMGIALKKMRACLAKYEGC